MAQKTYAGVSVDVNDEGYFTDPSQWTKEIAVDVAKQEGVELTDKFESTGFNIVDLQTETIHKLSKIFPPVNTNLKNPLDLGAFPIMVMGEGKVLRKN